ncbi:hypothetical protein PGB90_000087 [Kerria lacca]
MGVSRARVWKLVGLKETKMERKITPKPVPGRERGELVRVFSPSSRVLCFCARGPKGGDLCVGTGVVSSCQVSHEDVSGG